MTTPNQALASTINIANPGGFQSQVVITSPQTVVFADLPATPETGALFNISDSDTVVWGDTIAGSGGDNVLARYNGTNWTVVGI